MIAQFFHGGFSLLYLANGCLLFSMFIGLRVLVDAVTGKLEAFPILASGLPSCRGRWVLLLPRLTHPARPIVLRYFFSRFLPPLIHPPPSSPTAGSFLFNLAASAN